MQRAHRCLRAELLGVVALGMLFAVVGEADAQENRWYAGGAGLWSTQDGAITRVGSGVVKPGIGGAAFGASGEFGGFLTPVVSLAFEVSVPARFEATQAVSIPTIQIDNHHRDLVFSGLLHLHVPSRGPIRLALVGGPSVVQEDTLQRSASAPFGTTNFGPYSPDTQFTRWTWGLTVGGDLAIQVNRRVQIVPQIRFHWIHRADLSSQTDSQSALLSLGSLVTRPAVGVRLRF